MRTSKLFYVLCIYCFLLITLVSCAGSQLDAPAVDAEPTDTPVNTPTTSPTQALEPTGTPIELPPMFEEHPVDIDFEIVSGLFVYDVDADGDEDIIGASVGYNEIAWWRNDESNPYGSNPIIWDQQVVDNEFWGAIYLHVSDFDGDSDGDIVAGAYFAGEMALWRNDGGDPVTWTKNVIAEDLGQALGAFVADFDQDGDQDVLGVSGSQNRVIWWENAGYTGENLNWIEHTIDEGNLLHPQSVFAVDMDIDGDLDVLATALHSNDIAWWRNDGGNPITWTMSMIDGEFPYSHWVHVCDLDQDGYPDVMGAAYRGEIDGQSLAWWRNEGGDPISFSKQIVAENFKGAMTISSADMDLDDDLDIIATSNDLHEVAWWRNDGGDPITWTKQLIKKNFFGAWPLYTGDLDNDGDVDLVAGADKSHLIYWWENLTINTDP